MKFPAKTKAAVVHEHGATITIEEIAIADARADEIIVRMVATGVCHTDAVARAGGYPVPTPVVLGHEGAGIVEWIGEEVADIAIGAHVVLSFVACGQCSTCLTGRPALCQLAFEKNFLGQSRDDYSSPLRFENGEVLTGLFFGQSSFSRLTVAPAASAVVIDPDFDLALAGPLGCGFQTGAGAVLNSLRPSPGSSIAIFGVGAVGMAAVMAAKIAGCATIIAIDRHAERLALALELGATHSVLAGGDVKKSIADIVAGGVEFALDTTGHPVVVRLAVDSLRVAGTFGLIGASPFGTEVALDLTHMLFGRTFRGIIEGDSIPREFIPKLIEYHRQGLFPIERLVSYFELNQLEEAISASESGAVVKPIVRF
jgi:aryl-alcohol dehydrogenase